MQCRVCSGAHLPVSPVGRVSNIVLNLECIAQHHSKESSKEGQNCHSQVVPAVHNLGLNRPACKHQLETGVRNAGGRGPGLDQGKENTTLLSLIKEKLMVNPGGIKGSPRVVVLTS